MLESNDSRMISFVYLFIHRHVLACWLTNKKKDDTNRFNVQEKKERKRDASKKLRQLSNATKKRARNRFTIQTKHHIEVNAVTLFWMRCERKMKREKINWNRTHVSYLIAQKTKENKNAYSQVRLIACSWLVIIVSRAPVFWNSFIE